MPLSETHQQALVGRLNRVEGQIRGIRRMVQEPRLCVEILQQLAAAEAALNRISLSILRFHVETCVANGAAPLAQRAGGRGTAPRGVDLERLREIDMVVNQAIADKKTPGAVVLVGRGDATIFRKAYGHRALTPPAEPMTLH